MPATGQRSRSNTTTSLRSIRPLSRASTTSIQSNDHHYDQPPHSAFVQMADMPHNSRTNDSTNNPLIALESALLQLNNGRADELGGHTMTGYHHGQPDGGSEQQQQNQAVAPPGAMANFNEGFPVTHSISQEATVTRGSVGPDGEVKKKKGAASSATNDKELREMLAKNDGRSLREVAAEVIATERTPKAEKSKQLFAMLWLKSMCKTSNTSVPRNRVYSRYADRCATERVVTLNPASFGKLVRVIFPGIQTRRLGVRGESKYHYVDLALADEASERMEAEQANGRSGLYRSNSLQQNIDFNDISRLPADTAVIPSHEQSFDQPPDTSRSQPGSCGRLFSNPFAPGLDFGSSISPMYKQHLKFPPPGFGTTQESDTIELPNIQNYAPPKTDIDAANALTALYRTHCTSLIDCIRFCKEKQFFRLFTSFHGTLTVPVQKLFAHPDIAPWIKECDWLMYQKMIRFVSKLTLQVAPPVVLKFLDNIAKGLNGHISRIFHGLPHHVLEAKLEPATLYAHLLHRMLRANSTAHAAAAMLISDQNRDLMWRDWVTYVNPKRVLESELPNCGYEEAHRMLTQDVKALLQPVNTEPWFEHGSHYASIYHNNAEQPTATSSETIIDRLAVFLGELPSRFPQANARTILYCVSTVTTAALREITVENGTSLLPWWITKVFIDEMCLWLASLGGFLDYQPNVRNVRTENTQSPTMEMSIDHSVISGPNSNEQSRYSSVGEDFGGSAGFPQNESRVQYQSQRIPENERVNFSGQQHDYSRSSLQQFENDQDDSGIGMSFVDDGLDVPKYSLHGLSLPGEGRAHLGGVASGS